MNQTQRKLFGVALLILAVALGVTGMRFLRQPATYHATVTVKVERDKTDLPELGSAAVGLDYTYFIQTEIELIQSEATLSKVIERLDLNHVWGKRLHEGQVLKTWETVQMLKGRLQVQPGAGAALISIGAASEDAEEAANLANTVAQAYCEYRADYRRRLTRAALDELTNKFTEMTERVVAAGEKLEQAGQQLDPTARELAASGQPERESETLRTVRSRYSESVLRYFAQSNQAAIYRPTDAAAAEITRQLAARAEKAKTEMVAAEAATREELRKLELLRTYQAARQEFDDLNRLFAPLKKTVEDLQNDLRPQPHAPAEIIEQASVPTTPDARDASRGRMFVAGGGLAFALGVGLLLLGPKGKMSRV